MNSLSFSASAKSENFVGRDFVFIAINKFLHRYPKGYFTIVGVPGSGKSAILEQLVRQNADIIDYNAQILGKNRVEEFFTDICTRLIRKFQSLLSSENQNFDNYDSGVFSLLLQQISENLSPNQKLIIMIDGLDRVDIHSQAVGTNLFHLPRYLPDQVYFIFARRPYKKSHGGLLIEAPSQVLDLGDFPVENREDVKKYIQRNLTSLLYQGRREQEFSNSSLVVGKQENSNSPLLVGEGLGVRLNQNEDNFMYVQQILKAITDGFYHQPENINSIPPDLETYYQQLWTKMQGDGLSDVAINILRVLTAVETQPMSILAISQKSNADVFDVMEIMETWLEFLQITNTSKETKYQLYHHSFQLWVKKVIGKS